MREVLSSLLHPNRKFYFANACSSTSSGDAMSGYVVASGRRLATSHKTTIAAPRIIQTTLSPPPGKDPLDDAPSGEKFLAFEPCDHQNPTGERTHAALGLHEQGES